MSSHLHVNITQRCVYVCFFLSNHLQAYCFFITMTNYSIFKICSKNSAVFYRIRNQFAVKLRSRIHLSSNRFIINFAVKLWSRIHLVGTSESLSKTTLEVVMFIDDLIASLRTLVTVGQSPI